jgi:cytidine deaminase
VAALEQLFSVKDDNFESGRIFRSRPQTANRQEPVKHSLEELISIARSCVHEIDLGGGCDAGTVAAALETVSGDVHTGICVDVGCGMGVCAEHSAIVEMLKHRETEIAQIVAVTDDRVLPPCGVCREFMMQVSPANAGAHVILGDTESIPLKDLIPRYWMEQR